MIAPMLKAYIVARRLDRDRLIEALRDLGVVHLTPVDPQRATPDEQTSAAIDQLARAVQVLETVEPAGERPDLDAVGAAGEVIRLQRESAELRSRLAGLHRQIEQLALWGDVRLEQLEDLRQAGAEPRFFAVPADQVHAVSGRFVQVLHPLPRRRVLVAVVDRERPQLPDDAEPIPPPERDCPSIRAEAARIDADLLAGARRLGELARLLDQMRSELERMQQRAAFVVASRSGLDETDLFALQGWVPADQAEGLASGLQSAGIPAAVRTAKPAPDEQPPTLIRYPGWARPIDGLFRILGIVPGYRELDVSAAFMVALPIFVAMLVSDGGYGLLFLLPPVLFYRKVSARMGPQVTQLLIVIGAMAVLWGVVTGSFFGVGPREFQRGGSVFAVLGRALEPLQLVRVDTTDESRNTLMRISFLLGVIHLTVAQLWRALKLFPNPMFLSRVGWAAFLWGMFGVVQMFVLGDAFGWGTVHPYLMIGGAALVLLFSSPQANPLRRVALGLAGALLPAIGTFSDLMSYVRLMAVGLASTILAVSFNSLALSAPWILTVPILLFGHGLNIGLCLIALFAHGVRLNVLEFSNNVGMEWSGLAYRPFSANAQQET